MLIAIESTQRSIYVWPVFLLKAIVPQNWTEGMSSDIATAEPSAPERPVKRGVAEVVWAFVGWMAAWISAVVVASVVVGIYYSGYHIRPPRSVINAVVSVVSPLILLAITYARTRFDKTRLGLNPIERKWLLLILSLIVLSYVPIEMWMLGAFDQIRAMTSHASRAGNSYWWTGYVITFSVVLLAPAAEEFMFRGWLWTDLEKYWNYLGVMAFTGLAFLLAHAGDGLHKLYGVLVLAVVLTIARRFCNSTKATIWLHSLNNLYVMIVIFYQIFHALKLV